MEILIDDILTESLEKAITYKEYRELVTALVEEGKSTGLVQNESLSNYSVLNDKRMKRLDKTVKLTEEILEKAREFDGDVSWLVLTESWCGDAAQTMPVMEKIAELNEGIDFKVVLRDENEELMDRFLTNGARSIPKLIVVDNKSKEVLNTWGPRPSVATKMVQDYKEEHGSLTPEFKQDLQVWYNKDKGQNTAEDLADLL
ncbi:thioredoxin family protein [Leptobacterium flavescens]|uniref:Thioredoxin family protein n=1 Tax=Leptobacterium flavescens TaxID=472055 RepID=A0A6P0UNN1_9FLAO|nr:thioredoxin family protein [Leptobacterium flavescens]NER14577.1 thioredoxin family protein [Leptobacterium flavescens]